MRVLLLYNNNKMPMQYIKLFNKKKKKKKNK